MKQRQRRTFFNKHILNCLNIKNSNLQNTQHRTLNRPTDRPNYIYSLSQVINGSQFHCFIRISCNILCISGVDAFYYYLQKPYYKRGIDAVLCTLQKLIVHRLRCNFLFLNIHRNVRCEIDLFMYLNCVLSAIC